MEIKRTAAAIELGEMDRLVAKVLRQVVIAAKAAGDDAAERRLFSSPTSDGDEGLEQDWREYVRPELEHLFQTARETIRSDLATMTEFNSGGLTSYTLSIPLAHLDAWLNGLNQARLALAARHGFVEKDMDFAGTHDFANERDAALFQVYFYGLLQEIMLRELE